MSDPFALALLIQLYKFPPVHGTGDRRWLRWQWTSLYSGTETRQDTPAEAMLTTRLHHGQWLWTFKALVFYAIAIGIHPHGRREWHPIRGLVERARQRDSTTTTSTEERFLQWSTVRRQVSQVSSPGKRTWRGDQRALFNTTITVVSRRGGGRRRRFSYLSPHFSVFCHGSDGEWGFGCGAGGSQNIRTFVIFVDLLVGSSWIGVLLTVCSQMCVF